MARAGGDDYWGLDACVDEATAGVVADGSAVGAVPTPTKAQAVLTLASISGWSVKSMRAAISIPDRAARKLVDVVQKS